MKLVNLLNARAAGFIWLDALSRLAKSGSRLIAAGMRCVRAVAARNLNAVAVLSNMKAGRAGRNIINGIVF
jgi:hypothetical protein